MICNFILTRDIVYVNTQSIHYNVFLGFFNQKGGNEKFKKNILKIMIKNACYFFKVCDIINGKLKERAVMKLGMCKISDTLLKPFYSLNSVKLNHLVF